MNNSVNKNVIRLRTVNDLRIAKEHYRYNVKLQEEMLGTRLKILRSSFVESLKATLKKTGQQLLILAAIKLVRSGFKKQST